MDPLQDARAADWSYPTRMRFGPGRVRELPDVLAELGARRPLIVTDVGLATHAMIRGAAAACRGAGLDAEVFANVESNPTGTNVERGVAAYREGSHDVVVGIGGGSGLDAAKAIALMAGQTRPIWDFEDVGDNWKRVDAAAVAPAVAIPTTAGTGSEVGRASVILDEDAQAKRIVFHPRMLPATVISDPELTVGLPPALTAATGLDALAHCFEAYCAPGFHPMADGIALEGLRRIARWLPTAYADGANLEARGQMLVAASMGATAFQKGLGAVHALSHPIGARFGTHHGRTNAVLLPYVLVFNRAALTDEMRVLARALGRSGDGVDAVLGWLLELRADLGIPHTLGELGVPEDAITELAKLALEDPSAAGNPVPLTVDRLERLLAASFRGEIDGGT